MNNNTENKNILYDIYIFTKYNEILKKKYLVFRIETVQQFEHYRYDIDVNVFKKSNEIIFRMRGLKPAKIFFPGGGKAIFEKEFEELQGNYKIEIIGINKKVNNFEINIHGDLVKILSIPKDPFINIHIN